MKRISKILTLAATFALAIAAHASSHREALAILNEPCADNTDTFAWVSDRSHDKLYLIMDFNPLHEPGQGNQGLRACNGYRYEFHIAQGASLEDSVVYRIEFRNTLTPEDAPSPTDALGAGNDTGSNFHTPEGASLEDSVVYRIEFRNTLTPEDAPSPTDALGGGNELLWQLTGGTETMKVTRISSAGEEVIGRNIKVLPNNHGPQTDRLVYGLGPFKGYDSGDPSSREEGLYDQAFVDSFIHRLSNGGRIIAGQFDDPYQLDEKGIFDLVNL